jgi:DNA-binding response OmpR family regulator
MARLLVVEDDSHLALGLRTALRTQGYTVEVVGDAQTALERARQQRFDLILLDIMLPSRVGCALSKDEGYGLCEELRRHGHTTPIMMVTGNDTVAERVYGFTVGADDYVVKPFNTSELLARIKAVLRRAPVQTSVETYCFGDVVVDLTGGKVRRAGETIGLTALEFKLLSVFLHRRGHILTRDQLLDAVSGADSTSTDRTIDNHVMNLRRKIESNPKEPMYLVTVIGLGYRFDG